MSLFSKYLVALVVFLIPILLPVPLVGTLTSHNMYKHMHMSMTSLIRLAARCSAAVDPLNLSFY